MPYAGQVTRPLVRLGKRPDDCWTWLGAFSTSGHANKTVNGRSVGAHRWIWEQLFGPIPEGLIVYSTCPHKGCINPHHLALGMQADANRASVQTKLVPADVEAIRRAFNECPTAAMARTLADEHGITPGHVREIAKRNAWGNRRRNYGPPHVPKPPAEAAHG